MSDTPPKRRFRFSLLNLLLICTIVVMGLVIARLAPLRGEVQRLRDEAGYLTIRDRTKIHAIAVETSSPLVWKWKVYLPKSDNWLWAGVCAGKVPAEVDYDRELGRGLGIEMVEAQEVPVTVKVFRDLSDQWKARLEVGGGATYANLSDEQVSTFQLADHSSRTGVGRATVMAENGELLVLIRQTYESTESTNPAEYQGHRGQAEGILVWLQSRPRL